MITLFLTTFILSIGTFVVKRNFWAISKNVTNLSLEQSFLCWYTFSDMGNSQASKHRLFFIINNVTNLIIAFCFLVMVVCIALLGLSLLN